MSNLAPLGGRTFKRQGLMERNCIIGSRLFGELLVPQPRTLFLLLPSRLLPHMLLLWLQCLAIRPKVTEIREYRRKLWNLRLGVILEYLRVIFKYFITEIWLTQIGRITNDKILYYKSPFQEYLITVFNTVSTGFKHINTYFFSFFWDCKLGDFSIGFKY